MVLSAINPTADVRSISITKLTNPWHSRKCRRLPVRFTRSLRFTASPWFTDSGAWKLAKPVSSSLSVRHTAPPPSMPAASPLTRSSAPSPSGRKSTLRTALYGPMVNCPLFLWRRPPPNLHLNSQCATPLLPPTEPPFWLPLFSLSLEARPQDSLTVRLGRKKTNPVQVAAPIPTRPLQIPAAAPSVPAPLASREKPSSPSLLQKLRVPRIHRSLPRSVEEFASM